MPVDIIKDFAYAGFLLLVGYILRYKVPFLQKLYIPASVIGGIIGLLLGSQVLGKISSVSLSFSENISAFAMPLLAVVFATQLIGAKFNRDSLKSGLNVFLLNSGTACLQVGLCAAIMLAFIAMSATKAPIGMSVLPFTGFYGGHGVPAIAAGIFEQLGHWDYDTAVSVGTTFATIGLLFGIIVGIIIINIAVRKGMIAANAGLSSLSKEELSGFVPEEKRISAVDGVTTNDAMNPVAFQMAVICSIIFFAYKLMDTPISLFSTWGITICALLVSVFYTIAGKATSLGRWLDRKSLTNVSGAALEFLIVTSMASTNLSVFATYGKELVILGVATAIGTLAYVMFFGKRWHKKNWIENSLGTFGLANGVLATGFLLVRVADPDNTTGAALNLALGNSISTISVQMFFLMFFPGLIVTNTTFAISIAIIGYFVFTIAGCVINRRKNG